VDYASAGIGSPSHLAGELLAAQAGVQLVHVPYKGAPPVVSDLVGGRVAIFFNNLPSSMPLLQDGKIRALAVTTPTRAPALEQVPTMKEAGLPDFEVVTWYGLFAPAGTPKAVVDTLSRDLREALRTPAISGLYKAQGAIVVGNTPGEFAGMIARDRDSWSAVIKRAGIKAE
jgi:tripartite-type tricarboxylate transporter receptor subunit TctC